MEYLDHIISEQGISPSETKVQAIRDALEPTNVTELKRDGKDATLIRLLEAMEFIGELGELERKLADSLP